MDLRAYGFCPAGVDLTRADYSGKTLGVHISCPQDPTGSDRWLKALNDTSNYGSLPVAVTQESRWCVLPAVHCAGEQVRHLTSFA